MLNFRIASERNFVKRLSIFMLTVGSVLSLSLAAFGQAPSASPTTPAIVGVIGEVKNLDAASNQIIVRADSGVLYTVNLTEKTKYKRSAPGAKTLENATAITLAEVGSGDRVWAYGRVSEQQKTVPAQMLVVMSKADLAKKQEQERAEWRRRGVSGIVASLNPSTQEITVSSRSLKPLFYFGYAAKTPLKRPEQPTSLSETAILLSPFLI